MKRIITLMAVLMLTASCAKTLEERQEMWRACADKAVAAVNKKYEKLGQEEGQKAFLNDFCSFQKMDEVQCMEGIFMANLAGKWQEIVQGYTYEAVIQPECGDFPEDESKKSKD